MEKKYYWFKMQTNFFDDPQVRKLFNTKNGETYTYIYIRMLFLAGANSGVIKYKGFEKTFVKELSHILSLSESHVQKALDYLFQFNLIEQVDETTFVLPYAVEKIVCETSSERRARAFREQKTLQCNKDVTIDKDKDKDLEIDKEKEIDSSNPSNNASEVSTPAPDSDSKTILANTLHTPPTLQEIQDYCQANHLLINTERFYNYYQARNWLVGKKKIENWQDYAKKWKDPVSPSKVQKPAPVYHNQWMKQYLNS